MICVTEWMQHGLIFLVFSLFKIKKTDQEKHQHIYSTTNQPGTNSFFFFFFLISQNILCMLSNYQKWEKGKFQQIKKKEKQKYTTCKLLHKRKARSLRQCNSIAPIQIMHSTGNGNEGCRCTAHDQNFHQTCERRRRGEYTRGSREGLDWWGTQQRGTVPPLASATLTRT